jgi:hypothetical protein
VDDSNWAADDDNECRETSSLPLSQWYRLNVYTSIPIINISDIIDSDIDNDTYQLMLVYLTNILIQQGQHPHRPRTALISFLI